MFKMIFPKIFPFLKITIILTVMLSLLFGFFCIGMFQKTSMTLESMDMFGRTAVTSEQTCCGGSLSQHIQSWTNTFLTTPNDLRNNFTFLTLVFLASLIFLRALFPYIHIDKRILTDYLYLLKKPSFFVFDPLKQAFSRGILHPKLY